MLPVTPPEMKHEPPNLAIQITKYSYANHDQVITLQYIADALHISPRHISRLFYEYFGTGFAKTLSIYRLNYAKNYLCDTDLPVEEIASLVGFSTPTALYRLFKATEGMSIAEYRTKYSAHSRGGERLKNKTESRRSCFCAIVIYSPMQHSSRVNA